MPLPALWGKVRRMREIPVHQVFPGQPGTVCFLLERAAMATTQVEEPQHELLAAALSFLEKSGIAGHSMLVALPGGLKLGIELELIRPAEVSGDRERESDPACERRRLAVAV